MYAGSLVDADSIIIMGSNMAECHPVAFRWVMQAKLKGAKMIHVDPRFTRTSAVADVYAPIRAGSDIAFLGGLIRYMIENDKYFREYVVNYTNASTIINEEFQDTEELDGVFSGLMEYKGEPLNGFLAQYDNKTWQYVRGEVGDQGRAAATAQIGRAGSRVRQRERGGRAGRCRTARRSTHLVEVPAPAAAAPARRDAARPAHRLPDRSPPLCALHPGDGRAGDRLPAGDLPEGGRDRWRTTRGRSAPSPSATPSPGRSTPPARR